MEAKINCAYCGSGKSFTKEHIFPKFLYKKDPTKKLGYNIAADKYINSEAVIKDVCEKCNNEYLSELDTYGKDFYTNNRLEKFYRKRVIVNIKYEYNLLLRWLLKISYNSVRLKKEDLEWFEPLRKFLLTGNDQILKFKINLYVEIIKSHKIRSDEKKYLAPELHRWKFLPPDLYRAGRGNLSGSSEINVDEFLLRFVGINAFYFYLIFFKAGLNEIEIEKTHDLFKTKIKSAKMIDPKKDAISVFVSARDFLQAYEYQGQARMKEWLEYLQKK